MKIDLNAPKGNVLHCYQVDMYVSKRRAVTRSLQEET